MATFVSSFSGDVKDDDSYDYIDQEEDGGSDEAVCKETAVDCDLPHDLDDFSCTSHSMDFAELCFENQELGQGGMMESLETFHSSYDLGTSLGEGAFGTVHRCYKLSSTGERKQSFAVKTVPMEVYNHDEIEILSELMECPTITQVRDVFYEDGKSYIVMEEMQGGELLTRIAEKGCYAEREAKILFLDLLQTVLYCHCNGIAHCDIKPENILLKYKDEDTIMQLADFGLAKRFITADGCRKQLFDMDGSAEYAAPEVFNRPEGDTFGYDERCDIWSLGVVLYVLLGGYAPFEGQEEQDTMRRAASGKFKFHRQYWKDISVEAKVLIVKMLQVNPDERCSIEEALDSPWFNDCPHHGQNTIHNPAA